MDFKRDYFVHYYNSDIKLRLLIKSLFEYFEDIALLQSEEAGIGLDFYAKHNIGWVLYKWDIHIYDYPKYKDTIGIVTEPKSFERFYAHREFHVYDSSELLLVKADSIWIFMDTSARRPMRIPPAMYKGYNLPAEEQKIIQIEEIKFPDQWDFEREFFVRQSDIDFNNHVNNIKYIEWALETISPESQQDKHVSRIKVIYKKETKYGKKIKAQAKFYFSGQTMRTIHRICEDDISLCFIEITWQPD